MKKKLLEIFSCFSLLDVLDSVTSDSVVTSSIPASVSSEILLKKLQPELEEFESYREKFYQLKPSILVLSEMEEVQSQIRNLEKQIQGVNEGNKITQTYLESFRKDMMYGLISIQESFNRLEEKTNKMKSQTSHLPLRDAITDDIFNKLMLRAGYGEKRQRRLAFQLVYILLYYGGWRINEIRLLRKDQILELIQTGRINIYESKTESNRYSMVPDECRRKLASMKKEIDYVFSYGDCLMPSLRMNRELKKIKSVGEKVFIKLVNEDIKKTCEFYEIPGEFSSHSFRVGRVTRLLIDHPIHVVSKLVGHRSLLSTERYNRYTPDGEHQRDILNRVYNKPFVLQNDFYINDNEKIKT